VAVRPYFLTAVLVALGCAEGDTSQTTFGSGPPGGAGGDADSLETTATSGSVDESTDGGSMGNSSPPGPDSDSTAALDAADDDVGEDDATSLGDASSDGVGDADAGESTDGGGLMCPQQTTCVGAAAIGSVSGDSGSSDLQRMGSDPAWIQFQVTEDNDDIAGEELQFSVTLTSPPCCDFDLYVYRGVEGGNTGCNGILESSVSGGAVDSVSMSWGEGIAANGVDDDAWVAVEIVPKNDQCQAGSDWTLVASGD